MIAVIADDLTGAAEIGGVGLRFGLKTEVRTTFNDRTDADLLVIDSDTRSRGPREAGAEVTNVLKQLRQISPEWIYKKVDSVLRGPILAELEAALTALSKRRALLVPANPSLGRQVRRGHYFIDGIPLSETDFANDPEHPAESSDVLELLGRSEAVRVCVLGIEEAVPPAEVAVGEVSGKADLRAWARRCDDMTLAAGASEFFAALLESKGFCAGPPKKVVHPEPVKPRNALFVCAGSSAYSRKVIGQAGSRGIPVSTMPSGPSQAEGLTEGLLRHWTNSLLSAFERCPRVIMAIGQAAPLRASNLRNHTAAVVENVLNRADIGELYIEGGATASAVVRRLQWTRFFPCRELARGVVRMRVESKPNLRLTVKPGSYPWPENMWKLT